MSWWPCLACLQVVFIEAEALFCVATGCRPTPACIRCAALNLSCAPLPLPLSACPAAAFAIKERIYGNRIVLFAPLYIANYCVNNCRYCAFRQGNKHLEVRGGLPGMRICTSQHGSLQ